MTAAQAEEARAVLTLLLRLAAANAGGPDIFQPELDSAVRELCDVAGDPALLASRIALSLNLAATVLATAADLLTRPESITASPDEQDALRRLEAAIETELASTTSDA